MSDDRQQFDRWFVDVAIAGAFLSLGFGVLKVIGVVEGTAEQVVVVLAVVAWAAWAVFRAARLKSLAGDREPRNHTN